MCNTKCNDKPCIHEEDLMCCPPLVHCCGGYSEHNNCCPHDGGCHRCCDCHCCWKWIEKLNKKVSDLETVINADDGVKADIEQLKNGAKQIKDNLNDLTEQHNNDVDDIRRDHNRDKDAIDDQIDDLDDRVVVLDGRVDALEDGLTTERLARIAEDQRLNNQDTINLNISKQYTDNKIADLVDNAPEALDTLKEIADALKDDDDVMAALNQLIITERRNREEGDHILELADAALSERITAEVNRATAAEQGIRSDLVSETARATSAETTLNNRITSEIAAERARAQEAERDLGEDISAETARAQAAEAALGTRITNEIKTERDRATAAETALGVRITNEIAAEASRADAAISAAVDGLDSSTIADNNYALRGIVIENGKIKSNTQIKVPTNNNELVNGRNYQDATQVSTSISTAIGNLDSNIPAQANKAIASVTETNGILSGTYTDTIAKAISDGGGRNIVNTYIDTITTGGNKLHYHTGAGTTDITIPYSVKASQDENGDVISNTYLKVAGAATDADATLQSASRTKIATVANTDLHVSLPRLVDNISLALDPATYKISATLKGGNTTISTSNEIDLPLETMVVSGSYDSANKKVILTLKNGQTISFSVADLISGLVNTNDSRLSDARPASDVYNWAKQSTKPSYSWSEITGKPTIPDAQVQANWAQNNSSAIDYIKNKPNLATVATSGSYNDLINKPTLFSGNYNDLTNKPTIPSTNVTIGGTTYTLQQAIDYIVGMIPTQYWTRTNGTLKPATATDTVTAPAFYDSSVN